MGNTNLVQEIITSPEAERMLHMVTKDFYNNSRTGLWMFEVIGREYDDMAKWARELKLEAFPQTCTWSISIWEFIYGIESDETLTLERRREQILAKKLSRPPINPDRVAFALSFLSGCPVYITDPISPYTFRVVMDESETIISNHPAVIKLLRTIKPSHLSFRYETYIGREYAATDYSVGATSEFIEEEFFSHD